MVLVRLLLWITLAAGSVAAQAVDANIVAVIQKSADDWNRGDIAAFVECYEKSPQTTFVGSEVSRGTDKVLERYRRTYPDVDHMGKLTFSELDPRMADRDIAIVTGRFRLEREERFGGKAQGIFTLVMRKTEKGWRIIHDHTSALK